MFMIVSKEDFPVYDVYIQALVKSGKYSQANAAQNMGAY